MVITLVSISTVAHAANGGLFGEILNLILTGDRNGVAGKNWENPGDGTVANAQKLGGKSASDYQRVLPGESCGGGKCIAGFNPDGTVNCR